MSGELSLEQLQPQSKGYNVDNLSQKDFIERINWSLFRRFFLPESLIKLSVIAGTNM